MVSTEGVNNRRTGTLVCFRPAAFLLVAAAHGVVAVPEACNGSCSSVVLQCMIADTRVCCKPQSDPFIIETCTAWQWRIFPRNCTFLFTFLFPSSPALIDLFGFPFYLFLAVSFFFFFMHLEEANTHVVLYYWK